MNWFKRVSLGLRNAAIASELAQDVQTQRERVETLAGHIDEFTAALGDQERQQAQLLTEWASTLDKIGRWASRQSARERRDTDKKLDTLAAGPGENGSSAPEGPMTKPQLRARAAQMRMRPHVSSHEGQ